MSGESTFLSAYLTANAVYWGSPQSDGIGGRVFDEPVELEVRWERKSELFIDTSGQQAVSRAVVYTTSDVDLGGYLYLGTITDLTPQQLGAPLELDGTYEIRRVERATSLDGAHGLTKIFL